MGRDILVLAAALLGAGIVFGAIDASAQTHDPKVAALEAARAALIGDTPTEAHLSDINVFRQSFLDEDNTYSPAARAEAIRRLDALKNRAGAVSQAQFELELSRIVALADNGHTAVFPMLRAAHLNRIPLRLATFGEDFYVVRAAPEHADLLGARLVSIDGHDVAEIRTAARSLMGGVDGWRDRYANYLIESPEQLNALNLAAVPQTALYRFAPLNGAALDRQIAAAPPQAGEIDFGAGANRDLFPAAMASQTGWSTLLAADRAPWSLQDPQQRFRWRNAPEIDGMVIELRQTHNAEGMTIADALAGFDAAITENHPHNLVLDMRWNGGGDLNTARDFVQALPARVPGRIFVLTSPWTFSAAISTAGYLKQAAPDRVTIVGEAVGDRLNFFSEGAMVELPNSRLMVLYATERHDYVTGCEGFSDCHGNVVRSPIRVPNLDPEIAAPWTIEAYVAGRDPGMEAVMAALR
jgi:hypothetical protein